MKMKQLLLIIGLCLASTTVFAQKAAVTGAERIAKNARGNFNEARNLIKGALVHAETKDDPKTWFIAGQVEDAQFNAENTKQMLGQQPNEPVMYEALSNSLPFYLKAYELDQRPDDRGRVRPKYDKNIRSILGANHLHYYSGGGYWFGEREYQKSFDCFEQYLEIANLPYMAGTKAAARDSNFMMVQYYAAMVSTTLGKPEIAIKTINRAKNPPYNLYEILGWLCYEYGQINDTVNLEKTYEEGFKAFPDSSLYVESLVEIYIASDRNEKALDMLNTAIANNASQAHLYESLGKVYENIDDYDKAETNYVKASELNPDNPLYLFNPGRIYYNQAVNKLNDTNQITDVDLYNQEKAVVKTMFEKARPYFERIHQILPNEVEFMIPLRTIYYNLDGMQNKFDEVDAKIESLYQ